MVGESRALTSSEKMTGHLAVGEGQMYRRSRVMPGEGSEQPTRLRIEQGASPLYRGEHRART